MISGLATGITPLTPRASMFRLIPRCLALFRHVPEQVSIPTRPSICNQIEQFNDGTVSTKPGHSTLFRYVPECSSKAACGDKPCGCGGSGHPRCTGYARCPWLPLNADSAALVAGPPSPEKSGVVSY